MSKRRPCIIHQRRWFNVLTCRSEESKKCQFNLNSILGHLMLRSCSVNGPGARTQRPFPEQNVCCATCIIYGLILALVRNYSGGGERGQRPSLSALLLICFCLLCSFRLHTAGDGQIVSRKQPRARISEADFRHHWRKHPHHNRTGYVPAWTFHRHQCISS